jgi:hypothetical protein
MLQLKPSHRAELIQVIRTTLERRGEGVKGSPIRVITQYWSTDGELLAEVDPCVPVEAASSRNQEPS